MKCAMVIANRVKQIMLTPETPEEKAALALITLDDEITLDIRRGSFYGSAPDSAAGYTVQECQGGYLRAYDCAESKMLVLRPKAA